jgi:hypothetical protein
MFQSTAIVLKCAPKRDAKTLDKLVADAEQFGKWRGFGGHFIYVFSGALW